MSDLYHEVIIEEFKNRQNYGELSDADITLTELNSSCGDRVTISLKIDNNGEKKIIDIKWQGEGCAISVATMSLLSQHIKGKTASEIQKLTQQDLEQLLGLETEISSGRVKCLLLGLNTIKKMI